MSLKDRFDKFIDYFTEDGEETTATYQPQDELHRVQLLKNCQRSFNQPLQKMPTSLAYMLANKNWLCKAIVQMKK